MKEDDDYQMILEENFLKHIGYEHVNRINEQLDREIDKENVSYPIELDEWFKKFSHTDKMRNSKKPGQSHKNKTQIYFRRVAVILFFVIGINIVLITNVEAFRLSIFDTFINVTSKFTQVDFVRSDDYGMDEVDVVDLDGFSMDWQGAYYPTLVPEGYEVELVNSQENTYQIILRNPEDHYILFYQSNIQLSHMSNTEDGTVEQIIIGDNEGLYINHVDVSMMTMKHSGNYIMIEADHLTKDELLLVMENLKEK